MQEIRQGDNFSVVCLCVLLVCLFFVGSWFGLVLCSVYFFYTLHSIFFVAYVVFSTLLYSCLLAIYMYLSYAMHFYLLCLLVLYHKLCGVFVEHLLNRV